MSFVSFFIQYRTVPQDTWRFASLEVDGNFAYKNTKYSPHLLILCFIKWQADKTRLARIQ